MTPRHRELNPETEAELRAVMEEAWRQVMEQDQLANESARVWANGYEKGGEEAAKNTIRERLRELERLKSQTKRNLASKT